MSASGSPSEAEASGLSTTIPGTCPTAIDIGNAGWTILHTSAVAYPYAPSTTQQDAMRQFILSWSHVYACSWCGFHMRQYVAANPPAVADKNSVTRYVCELHNEVNRRLGKDEYDCDPIVQLKRWHPGYPDHLADEPTIEEKLAAAAAKEKETIAKRHRLEEAERERIAALGLSRPEKRSATGWRAWVAGGSAESGRAAANAAPGNTPAASATHSEAHAPTAAAPKGASTPKEGSAGAWRKSDTSVAAPADSAIDKNTPPEMSPGLMNTLLSRIKGCKVFCPDEAK